MSAIAYDDLAVGARFASPGRTITETDLSLSCMLTGDWHPIHADEEFARTTPVGKRMLHGPFGILIAMGMATRLPEYADEVIAATGLQDWRYHLPIVVGDTLHTETEIVGKRITSDGKRAIIDRRIKLINQEGRVIQEGLAGAMLRLAAPPAAGGAPA
jgi:acyl dehydratase